MTCNVFILIILGQMLSVITTCLVVLEMIISNEFLMRNKEFMATVWLKCVMCAVKQNKKETKQSHHDFVKECKLNLICCR